MADACTLTITDRQSDVGRRDVAAAVQTGIGGITGWVLPGTAAIVLARRYPLSRGDLEEVQCH